MNKNCALKYYSVVLFVACRNASGDEQKTWILKQETQGKVGWEEIVEWNMTFGINREREGVEMKWKQETGGEVGRTLD